MQYNFEFICLYVQYIIVKSFNKKLKSVGMTLEKGKEQDGMMLTIVKIPSIPTSVA